MLSIISKKDRLLLGVLLVSILVSYVYFHVANMRYISVTSFDQCVTAGFPVLEIYPEVCKMPGKTFANPRQEKTTVAIPEVVKTDNKPTTYFYEGQQVVVVGGKGTLPSNPLTKRQAAEIELEGSSLDVDLNNDNRPDTVFLLRTSEGYYYLTASLVLNTEQVGLSIFDLGFSSSAPSLFYKNGEVSASFLNQKGNLETSSFIFEKNLLQSKLTK